MSVFKGPTIGKGKTRSKKLGSGESESSRSVDNQAEKKAENDQILGSWESSRSVTCVVLYIHSVSLLSVDIAA